MITVNDLIDLIIVAKKTKLRSRLVLKKNYDTDTFLTMVPDFSEIPLLIRESVK